MARQKRGCRGQGRWVVKPTVARPRLVRTRWTLAAGRRKCIRDVLKGADKTGVYRTALDRHHRGGRGGRREGPLGLGGGAAISVVAQLHDGL